MARQTAFVRSLFESLWESAVRQPDVFQAAIGRLALDFGIGESLADRFIDALAAMTDRQALDVARVVGVPPTVRSLPRVMGGSTPVLPEQVDLAGIGNESAGW